MSGNPWASVGHTARLWPKFFAGPLLAYADPPDSRRAENAIQFSDALDRVAEILTTSKQLRRTNHERHSCGIGAPADWSKIAAIF